LVCLVEPHPLAARYLVALLRRNPALEVIVSGIDLPGDAVLQSKPSACIIDGAALPFPLAAFLRTLRMAFGDAKLLVIGSAISDDDLCRLLFQGVSGFISYEKVEQEVCVAVEALLKGRMWVSPRALERYWMVSSGVDGHDRRGCGTLSPRESEIVGLLRRRLSDKEIAAALRISERTVRFHLKNVFDKLGVHDRYSVIELARNGGLDESQDMEDVSLWKRA
jgi:DNA-binding NarL/FixJ family response regulator